MYNVKIAAHNIYDLYLLLTSVEQVNSLSEAIFGTKVVNTYQPPAKHTGEAFGLVYLYRQSGKCFSCEDEELDKAIDEGFEEFTDSDPFGVPLIHPDDSVSLSTVMLPADTIESDEEEEIMY